MFRRWGHFVARHRVAVLLMSLVVMALPVPLIPAGMDKLSAEGWDDPHSQSFQVGQSLAKDFGQTGSEIFIIFSSDQIQASDPAFQEEMQNALEPLRGRPEVLGIYDYVTTGADRFNSKDGHKSYALIQISTPVGDAGPILTEFRNLVKTSTLTQEFGGGVAATESFNNLVSADLRTQEGISLPVTLILLVFVFGSVVAAGLPLAVGLLTIPATLGGIALIALLTDTSIYVVNITTVLGLALAIDYSLFIVTRFREELARLPVADAIGIAMATSGKAVLFSGVTVAIGLLGLTFFPMFALRTMGIAGAIVVSLAVFFALTFLPAMLALLGPRVNRWRVRNVAPPDPGGNGLWHRLALLVMRRAVLVMLAVLLLLLSAGLPFLNVNFAMPGMEMLPKGDESRSAFESLMNDFPQAETDPVVVVARPVAGWMTDPGNLARLQQVVESASQLSAGGRVESIFDFIPGGDSTSAGGTAGLLAGAPPELAARAQRYLTASAARLDIIAPVAANSPESKDLVRELRALDDEGGLGLQLLIGGTTASNMDLVDGIVDRVPRALAFIVVVTYVVLFLLLGSIFLPFKAIIMNLLSITASFGALVWIFQDGHLQTLFRFEPVSYVVPTTPVMMFCILFGLSMDYEVLMLSRMKEEYDRSGDNTRAVALGLERTGRVITSAALIMVALFGAALFDRSMILKSMGVGMAIAVLVDATIVRALLVPATMRLMGTVNWWAPAALKRLQARAGMAETSENAFEPTGPPLAPAGSRDD